jgi:hypothetical protein
MIFRYTRSLPRTTHISSQLKAAYVSSQYKPRVWKAPESFFELKCPSGGVLTGNVHRFSSEICALIYFVPASIFLLLRSFTDFVPPNFRDLHTKTFSFSATHCHTLAPSLTCLPHQHLKHTHCSLPQHRPPNPVNHRQSSLEADSSVPIPRTLSRPRDT